MICKTTWSTTLASLALALLANGQTSPVVNLGYAQYQGAFDSALNVTSFVGMRYAKPPTGSLRFHAPQTPSTVAGVQIANVLPPQCPQGNQGTAATSPFTNLHKMHKKQTTSTPEDCLFLSVTVPGQLKANSGLPVVMWIHGGGYAQGNSSIFFGSDLVKESLFGAIVVTIQYRLGAFGFLAGSQVKQHGALNAGLLDQNFAMKWIQQHIALFGGDPHKVTIWGESAGAGSVLQHIVAHEGNTQPPLFRAAITSSAFMPSQYQFNDPIPEALYTQVVQQTGCSSATNTFACLQQVSSDTLNAANMNITLNSFFGTFGFAPVVDGTFIVERPFATLQKGKANGQVLLSVTNGLEGLLFVDPGVIIEPLSVYAQQLFPTLSSAQISSVVAQYAGVGVPDTYTQAIGLIGESIFICPTYRLLKTFTGRAWKGEFAVPPATHGQDVVYYFPSTQGLGIFSAISVITGPLYVPSFSEGFLAVVMTLDPNNTPDPQDITPNWPQYSPGNTEMLFGVDVLLQPDILTITTDTGLVERCRHFLGIIGSVYWTLTDFKLRQAIRDTAR